MECACLSLCLAAIVVGFLVYKFFFASSKIASVSQFKKKTFMPLNTSSGSDEYDVIIAGAGPAGATCAYYLAKAGKRCLLLEKKKFPRDKFCGDAVCKTAIEILDEMGLYEKLVAENKAKIADSGGMVSPSGLSYIGRSKELLGKIPAAIAVKRTHLDEAIAMAAKEAGAVLMEESPVKGASLDKRRGLWSVSLENSEKIFSSRLLVCADGATSKLATSLGIVKEPPSSQCSRAYVEGGSHRFKADGVVFYNRDVLPGYSALFKHPNDELNFCVYIIPGNPKVTPDDLPKWHEFMMKNDPHVSRALGDNYVIERMRPASLRLGGIPKSYDDHLIIVGDAAGMIDPMTGEGIHHAMEAGKMGAEFLGECLREGVTLDSDVMHIFHERWMERFGHDYKWSMWICQLVYRFPILLDAATAAVIRKGDKFLVKWADIMTGRVPKINLLRPEFVIVITYELCILIVKKLLGISPTKAVEAKSD